MHPPPQVLPRARNTEHEVMRDRLSFALPPKKKRYLCARLISDDSHRCDAIRIRFCTLAFGAKTCAEGREKGERRKRGLLMEIFAVNGDDFVKVIMALY